MLQAIDYLKMILETKYLSLTQMIVLSLATQAHFSRRWQNKRVLQVTPQSVVIVTQNEGETSL
jgi:hypothetical protein